MTPPPKPRPQLPPLKPGEYRRPLSLLETIAYTPYPWASVLPPTYQPRPKKP